MEVQIVMPSWRQLRGELRRAGPPDLWRYTADLIYLIENPVVREAFFPSESQQFSVEPAVPQDGKHIHRLAQRHEGNTALSAIDFWWDNYPRAFHVVRDAVNKVAGFYCLFDPSCVAESLVKDDPIAFNWWQHLRAHSVQNTEKVLFLRRWLSWDEGEAPSPVQAACWLDIKRTYMELRPNLRRVYLTVRDLTPYAPVALRLGFSPLSECNADMANLLLPYSSATPVQSAKEKNSPRQLRPSALRWAISFSAAPMCHSRVFSMRLSQRAGATTGNRSICQHLSRSCWQK